jgi:hypothetical protein
LPLLLYECSFETPFLPTHSDTMSVSAIVMN